jgi:hypothetical protein
MLEFAKNVGVALPRGEGQSGEQQGGHASRGGLDHAPGILGCAGKEQLGSSIGNWK